MRNSSDEPMIYMVIQSKENSVGNYSTEDGTRTFYTELLHWIKEVLSENPDLTVLVNDEVVSKRSKLEYDIASVEVVLNSLATLYEGYLSSSFSILTIGNLAFEKSPIIDVPFSMA